MEELESLEDRARAVGTSVTKAVSGVLNPEPQCRCLRQEMYIRDLNLEFTNIIELAERVKSAQVATEISYKDWQKNKLQTRLTGFLTKAGLKYYNQGESRNSDY